VKILRQPHVENQQRHGDAKIPSLKVSRPAFENMAIPDGLGGICAKTLSFFNAWHAAPLTSANLTLCSAATRPGIETRYLD
jgi:hypothetical protein